MRRRMKDNSLEANIDEVIKCLPRDDTFHIGQSYEKRAAITLSCAYCGSKEFMVGKAEYFTAIRCPNCGWEACIHDG